MDKKEMLHCIIAHYTDGNKSKFAQMLGVTPQAISTWEKRNTFDLELIFAKCENINSLWLLTGEGEMLKREEENIKTGDALANALLKMIEEKDLELRSQAETIGKLRERIRNLEEKKKK